MPFLPPNQVSKHWKHSPAEPLHLKTPPFLASFKSRLVLPFWYRLIQAVLEKRLLNGCSIVVVDKMKINEWIFLELCKKNLFYFFQHICEKSSKFTSILFHIICADAISTENCKFGLQCIILSSQLQSRKNHRLWHPRLIGIRSHDCSRC